MRLLPRSLYGRLLALSALATVAALAVAGVAIGGVLERFVTSTLDDRLADKLVALGGAVHRDGSLDQTALAQFDVRARDADWRVEAPGGTLGSARLADGVGIGSGTAIRLGSIARYGRGPHPPPPPGPAPATGLPGDPGPPPPPLLEAGPFETRLSDGTRVHGRWDSVPTDRGPARIAVAVPHAMIERPLRAALVPLALSLLALGVALAAAAVIQLRLGLRPLTTLRDQVAAIRAGRAEALPPGQPAELAPLAAELNALAADNRAALATARGSAANLAHGLKTPVATLGLALAESGRDPDGSLAAQVARIDAVIRHHLARARSVAVDRRARAEVAPVLADLVATFDRLPRERAIALDLRCDPVLAAAIDPHDLTELAGNLIDNAIRHAGTRVAVDATPVGRRVRLVVADDGPGIPAADRPRALAAGDRLDEAGDGHGFGLAIAAELAQLYGGTLTLADADGGGLAVTVELPSAASMTG